MSQHKRHGKRAREARQLRALERLRQDWIVVRFRARSRGALYFERKVQELAKLCTIVGLVQHQCDTSTDFLPLNDEG